jgi:hypothetical protein
VTGAGVTGSTGVLVSGVPVNDNSTVAGLPTHWSVSSQNTNATGFGAVFVGLICASTTP